MAVALKRAASAPAATTPTTLYTCPASTTAVTADLTICNRSATATTFRVARRLLGAAVANEHYYRYDATIDGYASETISGITMIATDIIEVYNTAATVSFNLSIQENS